MSNIRKMKKKLNKKDNFKYIKKTGYITQRKRMRL